MFSAMMDANEKTTTRRIRCGLGVFGRMFVDPWFWFWTFLLAAGFAYVASVLCHRANPLYARYDGYGEFIKLMISAPVLYFVGVRANLKPEVLNVRNVLVRDGLGYALPFFVALHWFYLQEIPQLNYSLTYSDIAHMHPVGKAVFALGGLLIAALLIYHLVLARRERILAAYALSFVGAIALLVGTTWILRGAYYPHIHHYFLFGFFIPWARFRNPVSLMSQAFCAGVYVEGISEWSMATLWYPHH